MSTIASEPQLDFDLIREAFDGTVVGLVVITPEGVFRQVNRAFCEMTEYKREELEGQSFRDITHPDDIARDEEHLGLIRTAGAEVPNAVDKRFITRSGKEVWVRRSAAAVRDASGQVRFIVGAFVDLSEQRHATSELERHLHFTRALVDAIPNPVYFKDREGRYQVYNRAWAELFGGGKSWIGKSVFDLFHQDDVEHARAAFGRIADTGQLTEAIEFRLRHRAGDWRTFESLGTNCLANPHIRGVVFNSRDITDRKVIQQRIQHLAYH